MSQVEVRVVSEDQYSLVINQKNFPVNREKFEDLYYAVPINNSIFLRLLLDNICQTDEDRAFIQSDIENLDSVLDELQKILQSISLD